MVYRRQLWTDYDERKTETQNIENGSVVTSERMNNIERGIYDNTLDLEDLQRQIESTQSGMIGEYNSEDELKKAYPNGTKGYAVVWLTEGSIKVAYTYTYKSSKWTKGGVWNGMGIANNSLENRMFKKKEVSLNKLDLDSNSIFSGEIAALSTIHSQTGEYVISETSMATNYFVKVNKNDTVLLLDEEFQYCPFLYNLNGSFISSKGVWESEPYTFNNDYLVKFTVRLKNPSTEIVTYLDKVDEIISIPNQEVRIISKASQIKNEILNSEQIEPLGVDHTRINWDNNILMGITCVHKTIHSQTGEYTNSSSGAVIATMDFVKVKRGDYVALIDNELLYCPFLYDLEGNFISSKGVWESESYTFNNDYLVKFSFRYSNSSLSILDLMNETYKIIELPKSGVNLITKPSQIADGILEISHFKSNDFSLSHLFGRNWASLGDSITARDWYQQLMVENYGIISQNFGLGGSTIARNTEYNVKSFVERMIDLPDDIDYLTIWGGVNDFGFGSYGYRKGSDLGTFDSRDDTNFYGALHTLMRYVIQKYKNKGTRIGFIVTTPVADSKGNGQVNSKGHSLEDYCNAAREVCEFYSISFLDLQKNSGMNQLNVDVMTSTVDGTISDGLHPSKLWFEMKKYLIADFLMSL